MPGLFEAFILPAIISAIATTTVGLVGTAVNSATTKSVNEENLAYAQGMTEKQWQRDDSSLQRQVADAQSAGLSPLAVTGSMNSSSPLNYTAQAPQMDLASLIGAFSSFDNITQASQKAKEYEQKDVQFDKQLVHDLYKFNSQLQSDKDFQSNSLKQDLVKFNKEMLYQYDVLNSQNEQFSKGQDLERLQSISNTNLEQYRQICSSLGVSPKTVETSDYDKYLSLMKEFQNGYVKAGLKRGDSQISDKTSYSASAGAKLGAQAVGTGMNFGTDEANSMSVDMTKTNSFAMITEVLQLYPYPIFVIPEGEDIGIKTYSDAKME